jgi:ribosome hibernation promoting factor
MQVELRIRDTARRDRLRAHVERRLRFALRRFGNRVHRVVVRRGRVNGIRGVRGTGEARCHVEVRLPPSGTVTVKETSTDLFATIDRASGRVEGFVAHRLGVLSTRKTGRSQCE